MDITENSALLKGDEKRTEPASFRFKIAMLFLRTVGKPGPERWTAAAWLPAVTSRVGLQRVRDQGSCDDLSVSGRIKPEIGVADVPKPGIEGVLLFSFFSKVKFAESFL